MISFFLIQSLPFRLSTFNPSISHRHALVPWVGREILLLIWSTFLIVSAVYSDVVPSTFDSWLVTGQNVHSSLFWMMRSPKRRENMMNDRLDTLPLKYKNYSFDAIALFKMNWSQKIKCQVPENHRNGIDRCPSLWRRNTYTHGRQICWRLRFMTSFQNYKTNLRLRGGRLSFA